MERPTLLLLLFLSCHALQYVSSQGASDGNNGQQPAATVVPSSGEEETPSSGESDPQIPVPDEEVASTEAVDGLSGCQAICHEECEGIDVQCEYIDGAIPVLCGDEIELCKAGCEKYCLCQFTCGCELAEGCDDPCSMDCETQFKPAMEESTTMAAGSEPGAGDGSAGGDSLKVVYKKESEESDSSDGD